MGSRAVWRVRDRASFDVVRRAGRRARRGPVSVAYTPFVPEGERSPRVAFAVGRAVGGAVARNRLRRRVRAAFDALAGPAGPGVTGGTYLVSAAPAAVTLSPSELRHALAAAVEHAARPAVPEATR